MSLLKHTPKQVVEIDYTFIEKLDERMAKIENALIRINVIPQVREDEKYITPNEWCRRCMVSRWKYDVLLASGKLKFKKIGRKNFIEIGEVKRYFNGELTPEK